MSRTLSGAALAAITAQETGAQWVWLAELVHPSWGAIRLANAEADIVSGGQTYAARAFVVQRPDDVDGAVPTMRFVSDNVGLEEIGQLRAAEGPATCVFKAVLRSQPDTVEVSFATQLRNIAYNASVITGQLRPDEALERPLHAYTISVTTYPGLVG